MEFHQSSFERAWHWRGSVLSGAPRLNLSRRCRILDVSRTGSGFCRTYAVSGFRKFKVWGCGFSGLGVFKLGASCIIRGFVEEDCCNRESARRSRRQKKLANLCSVCHELRLVAKPQALNQKPWTPQAPSSCILLYKNVLRCLQRIRLKVDRVATTGPFCPALRLTSWRYGRRKKAQQPVPNSQGPPRKPPNPQPRASFWKPFRSHQKEPIGSLASRARPRGLLAKDHGVSRRQQPRRRTFGGS